MCLFCGQGVPGAATREVKFAGPHTTPKSHAYSLCHCVGSMAQKRFIEALRIPEPPPPKQVIEPPRPAEPAPASVAKAPAAVTATTAKAAAAAERRADVARPSAATATAPAPAPAQPKTKAAATSASAVDQIVSMGWNKEQAVAALAAADGNLNGAIDILTSQAQAKPATAKPAAPTAKRTSHSF